MCFTDDICYSTNVQATTSWQYLESPNYPNNYPDRKNCGTNIQGTGLVELEIVAFETEQNYDYVTIYNQENGEELGKLTLKALGFSAL